MRLTIKPTKALYKSFPELKGKEITFLGLRTEEYCDGGYMVNVKIGEYIGEFAVGYFELTINRLKVKANRHTGRTMEGSCHEKYRFRNLD